MSDLPTPPLIGHVELFLSSCPNYVAVLVEGDSDAALLEDHFLWVPLSVGGKIQVIEGISELKNEKYRCVGIVDADFEHVNGITTQNDNISMTQYHDIEGDLIDAGLLTRLTRCCRKQVNDRYNSLSQLHEELLKKSATIGIVRLIFYNKRIEFPDGRLSIWNFIDQKTGFFDEKKFLTDAAVILKLDYHAFEQEFNDKLLLHSKNLQLIANGHDIIRFLTAILKIEFKLKNHFPNEKTLEAMISTGTDKEIIEKIKLWSDLEAMKEFIGEVRKLQTTAPDNATVIG